MPGFRVPQDLTIAQCQADLGAIGDGIFFDSALYEGPDPKLEYAKKYRWLFETISGPVIPGGVGPLGPPDPNPPAFDREDSTEGILLVLKKCTRPSPEFEVIKAHHAQSVISRPGKISWAPITMTFYEALDELHQSQVTKRLYDWWARTIHNYQTMLHGSVKNYQKDAVLTMLDGIGRDVYTYNLYNCWISKIAPSDLDYSTSEVCEIEVTLCYDMAVERIRI